MNSGPACAGQSTQTFLPKVGEKVFLCLNTGTKPRKGRSGGAEARVPLDQELRLKTNS
jgi:hypothetical protein